MGMALKQASSAATSAQIELGPCIVTASLITALVSSRTLLVS